MNYPEIKTTPSLIKIYPEPLHTLVMGALLVQNYEILLENLNKITIVDYQTI